MMRVLTRDITDPLALRLAGKTGVFNNMDLANSGTCSLIASSDLRRVGEDGAFGVPGRWHSSDSSGCNLFGGK